MNQRKRFPGRKKDKCKVFKMQTWFGWSKSCQRPERPETSTWRRKRWHAFASRQLERFCKASSAFGSHLHCIVHAIVRMCVLIAQSCPTLCDPMDYSSSGSSVHGILQARMLEWIAIPFSRGSSQPRDWIQVSCIIVRFFTIWATREAHTSNWKPPKRFKPSDMSKFIVLIPLFLQLGGKKVRRGKSGYRKIG